MAAKKKTGATNSAKKKTAKKKTATKKKTVAAKKKTAIKKKTTAKKTAVAPKKKSAPKKKATSAKKKSAPKKSAIAKRVVAAPSPAPVLYETAPIAPSEMLAPVEISRSPRRGGDQDRANHSKPEVQLQQQHLRTLRSPLRRPSVRGH